MLDRFFGGLFFYGLFCWLGAIFVWHAQHSLHAQGASPESAEMMLETSNDLSAAAKDNAASDNAASDNAVSDNAVSDNAASSDLLSEVISSEDVSEETADMQDTRSNSNPDRPPQTIPFGSQNEPRVNELPSSLADNVLPNPGEQNVLAQQNDEFKVNQINLANLWLRLAALGKSQGEIEDYLALAGPQAIEQAKSQLRLRVLHSLRIQQLDKALMNALDETERAEIQQKIWLAVSAIGLENDLRLQLLVQQEFLAVP